MTAMGINNGSGRSIGSKDRAIIFTTASNGAIACRAVLPDGLTTRSLRRVDLVVLGLLNRLEDLAFCEALEAIAETRLTHLAESLATLLTEEPSA